MIGCGNMGGAILAGMLRSRFVRPSGVIVSDVDRSKRTRVARAYHVRVARSNEELAGKSDLILLAVKPQQMNAVLEAIRPALSHRPLLVSIAAGVAIRQIQRKVGRSARVVRVMPNMPALVGAGISAVAPGRGVTGSQLAAVRRLLEGVGQVVRVPESSLEAVTAVSGSGPAYFFYLMEQMIRAGVRIGLSDAVARRLVVETAFGAGRMARESKEDPAVLRARVTSKGGTTEAALQVFKARKVDQALQRGIQAAAWRSKELTGQLANGLTG